MGIGKTSRSRLCLRPPGVLDKCTKLNAVGHMEFDSAAGTIRWTGTGKYKDHCLGIAQDESAVRLSLQMFQRLQVQRQANLYIMYIRRKAAERAFVRS